MKVPDFLANKDIHYDLGSFKGISWKGNKGYASTVKST
jgi:hypothetical protein